MRQFLDMVRHPQFADHLAQAAANPDSATGKRITSIVNYTTTLTGGQVAWSAEERKGACPRIMSLFAYCGAPSMFVTFAPSDNDSNFSLRIGRGRPSEPADAHIPLPGLAERFRIIAANPMAAAISYRRLVHAVLECIFGQRPAHRMKNSHPPVAQRLVGVLGVMLAFCGVTEAQARGSAHFHSLIFLDCGPRRIQAALSDPEEMTQVVARIDSVCRAWLSQEAKTSAEQLTSLPVEEPTKEHRDNRVPCPDPMVDAVAFEAKAEAVAASTNVHSHSFTCQKSTIGRYQCRLSYPRPCWNRPTECVELTAVATHSTLVLSWTSVKKSPDASHKESVEIWTLSMEAQRVQRVSVRAACYDHDDTRQVIKNARAFLDSASAWNASWSSNK